MDHSKKLAFVHAMTKMGLQHVQHYDEGGVTSNTLSGNVGAGTQQDVGVGGALAGVGAGAGVGAAAGSIIPGLGTAVGAGVGALIGGAPALSDLLTAQNGYQAQLAPTTQSNYSNVINQGAASALNASPVNSALAAEQGLSGQYGQIAQGQGYNPAQALLSQQTGQNIAQQAALQAGQRGASGNVGLLARQIGQQGAATQQNAVGQAATTQANQSLAALGAQAGLQNQIASQGLGEQGVGAQVLGTATGAQNAQNANLVNNYGQAQSLNQATASQNAEATNKTFSGLLGGISSLLSKGGDVHNYDDGGDVTGGLGGVLAGGLGAADSSGEYQPLGAIQGATQGVSQGTDNQGNPLLSGIAKFGQGFANGQKANGKPQYGQVIKYLGYAEGGETKKVPAMVSPGEIYLTPDHVQQVLSSNANPLKIGHKYAGIAKVHGDSRKNDTIPVTLDDGGVIIPRHVVNKMDAKEAELFVRRAHAKRGAENND